MQFQKGEHRSPDSEFKTGNQKQRKGGATSAFGGESAPLYRAYTGKLELDTLRSSFFASWSLVRNSAFDF